MGSAAAGSTAGAGADAATVTDAEGRTQGYAYRGHLLVQETDRTGLSFYFDQPTPTGGKGFGLVLTAKTGESRKLTLDRKTGDLRALEIIGADGKATLAAEFSKIENTPAARVIKATVLPSGLRH